MDTFWLDLQHAARACRRRPAFSLLAALTLSAGMGISTVGFTAVNALLLKPFRFAEVDRLGWVFAYGPGNPHGAVAPEDYDAFARHARTLAGVAAERRVPLAWHDGSGVRPIWGLLVSGNYFDVLRPALRLGRAFTAREASRTDEPPAVVAERFWREHLGGASSLAAQSLVVNGRRFAIAGVLPETYRGPGGLFAPDVWLPMEQSRVLGLPGETTPGRPSLLVVGRRAAGASRTQVETELHALMLRPGRANAAGLPPPTPRFEPLQERHPEARALLPVMSGFVMAALGIVVLVACFNVAGLLVARAAERGRELAIRAALGAGRGRLARQLLLELMLIALAGGGGALVLALASADLLSAFSLPAPIPQRIDLSPDWRLVAFTVVLVATAGLAAGLAPALVGSRVDLLAATRGTAWRPRWSRGRWRGAFVGAQLAGATLFVSLALFFAQHFVRASRTDPGFPLDQVLVLGIDPGMHGADAARALAFYEGVAERLSAVPGVRRVALADHAPLFVGPMPRLAIAGRDGTCRDRECPQVNVYRVGPGYAGALGLSVLAGRDLTDADGPDAVLVSASFVSRFLGSGTGPGEVFRVAGEAQLLRVVGVVADAMQRSPNEVAEPHVYRRLDGRAGLEEEGLVLLVRSGGDARSIVPALRASVQAQAPGVPLRSVQTMRERMDVPLWASRTAARFFVVCAAVALLLAGVGLFGVTHIEVTQRLREFGIRRALGASHAVLGRQVVCEAAPVVAAGAAGGLMAAWLVARLAAGWLVGFRGASVSASAGAVLALAVVAAAAFAGPVARAVRAAPAALLRDLGTP